MSVNVQNLKDLRSYLAKELEGFYNEQEIKTIANILIKTLFGITRLHQIYNPDEPVNPIQSARIKEICRELRTGKPLQYITGETVFYDCIIKVNENVLIPRPETEELVRLVITENKGYRGSLIDFGTGSGCIAIALASNFPGSKVTGVEISEEALSLAKENAKINNTSVSFIMGDLLNFDLSILSKAGVVVSNPPYVTESEKKLMAKNVLDFEPASALFVPDEDPLKFYKAILKISETVLSDGGKIYFEINEARGKEMFHLMESWRYTGIDIVKDINGKCRIIKGIKNG